MVLVEYTRDVTEERNDKEVTLYSKEKKHIQRGRGIICKPLKIKIAPKSNLFPSKVGWMSYPLEQHVIPSLLTPAKA